MNRLIENRTDNPVFEKFRTSKGNFYRYVGVQGSPAVMLKVVAMTGATVR